MTHLLRNMVQITLPLRNLIHRVTISKYNRKSHTHFIKPLYYLGNITGVTPFYDFRNKKLIFGSYCKLYGIMLIILHLFGGFKYIIDLKAFKLTGNTAYDLIVFVLFIIMLLIVICGISISIIKPNLFLTFLSALSKIDAVMGPSEETDCFILELIIGMVIHLSVSIYEYPIWVSLDLPLWFLLWDFIVSLTYHVTILLMYNFAIFVKYKFFYLNQLIHGLYDHEQGNKEIEIMIVDLYHCLQKIVGIFNNIFELPFICYLLYLILLISNMMNTILSGSVFAGISMTVYEVVRSYKLKRKFHIYKVFLVLCCISNY